MVNIARSWLHQCASDHVPSAPDCPKRRCEKYERTELPTRVLDIGPDTTTVVKLVITNNHYDYYVALSHCWGGGSCLMLTQENLDRFIEAVPMEAAPRNFRDAATIARSLGFRYLWVDSLCIVQDSYSDWDIEGSKMSDVYKNASLTISASASANTTMGILNPYIPASSTSLKHCIRLQLDEEEVSEIYLTRRVPMEENADYFVRMPLSTRGWALQEQILSRRNLYYGKRAIYWTCRSSHQSADGAIAGASWIEGLLSDMIPELFTVSKKHKTPDERTIYSQWLGIVRSYSNRDLTYGSDKLPAISALAREVHRLSGGTYLAGIWLADLFNGLLWHSTTPEARPNTNYRGPSWSWVGLDTEINFMTQDLERVPSSHDAEVIQIVAIPAGCNVFGAVQSGLARLKALTLEIDQSRHQYYYSDWSKNLELGKFLWRDKGHSPNFFFFRFDDDDGNGADYHPGQLPKNMELLDVPDDESSIEVQQCLALYLGIWAEDKEGALDFIDLADIGLQELQCTHEAYALLLRPSISSDEQSYERIGVLRLDILKSPLFNGNTWQTRVVTII